MILEDDFQIEEEFLFPATGPASEGFDGPASVKRRYDPRLFAKGVAVQAAAKAHMQIALDAFMKAHPEQHEGLHLSLDVKARAKSTPGAYKVNLALIELILGPRGSMLTQEECRSEIQERFPSFAVPKDWTKALKTWEMSHARKFAGHAAGCSPAFAIKAGMSLRDLHAAKRLATSKSSCEARTYSTAVTITNDAIIIGGLRVKLTSNRSNGKEYAVARLNAFKLEQALAGKRSK
jgi:hypothetical protein